MRTFRRLAPWFILGPITGPLAQGVYRNFRAQNHGLAWLYALAVAVSWYDLAIYGSDAVVTLRRLFLIF